MAAQTVIRLVSGRTVEAAQVYTVTQLNQHCGEVMREIARLGRPAAVTRQGKFVASLRLLVSLMWSRWSCPKVPLRTSLTITSVTPPTPVHCPRMMWTS